MARTNGSAQSLSNGMGSLTVNGANGSHAATNGHRRPMAERKPSSPMMPPFMTSAPGKVIVFGEHAVVHGKTALAAPISLRSYMLVTTLSKSKRTISLLFPDIEFNHTWHIDKLPWEVFHHLDKKKMYYDLVPALDPELVEAMEPHISDLSPDASLETRKIHRAAASSFLYLFLSLGSKSFPGCIYTLRSTLPIGAGLGSSASISVCISSALLIQIRALSGPHPDQPEEESNVQIERINRWAFVAECCIHGNPSGVDNTVASGGKGVVFKREGPGKPPNAKRFRSFPELPLLLINTMQSRSTAAEVAKVGALLKSQPVITDLMLEAVDKITLAAMEIMDDEDFDEEDSQSLQRVGELLNLNHGILAGLGVSHPRLERIRELVDTAGLGWTKLTGAGGGGCAITLLKPSTDLKTLRALEAKLDSEGYERYQTTLGGDGVGVLYPAVLKNGTEEEGGEEIDQEKFLSADGREGVEELVGVGSHEKREGWKFWS